MKKTALPFSYDLVLSLNSHKDLYNVITHYKAKHSDKKILSATLDHRAFNIHEKNYIKALIDHFGLDQLMFTIKPSAVNSIKRNQTIDFDRFREMAQVIFVLQCMARYNITEGLISRRYLELDQVDQCDASIVLDKVILYLEEFEASMIKEGHANAKKEFCSILSVRKLKDQLKDKTMYLLEEIGESIPSDKRDFFTYKNQINELEKNLFWVGFDPLFKEIPWEKKYEETRWNKRVSETLQGDPLYNDQLRYCTRCCLPETMEGIDFDEFGICVPCRSSEEKMHINWEDRGKKLFELLDQNRPDDYYDCMLPMSGGKDSTFQAHVLVNVYKVSALAVTHGANWMTLSGRYNLENCLQQFDLDHIIFHANRQIINKAARKSLTAIGDACWHCHIGAGAFVIQTALHWDVGLMVWGESVAERDGRGSYNKQKEASLLYNLEISGKVSAEDYADQEIPYNELSHWFYPEKSSLKNSAIRYLHLGDYMFWDEERQVDFIVRNYEWMNSQVENAFKGYKSTECVMAGVHDYSNFIKRGIGRATVQASDDVRRGVITREEGFELAKKYDSQRPHALDFYLEITGYSEEEFEKILVEARKLSKDASKLKAK